MANGTKLLTLRGMIAGTGWRGIWLPLLILLASFSGTYPIKLIERIVDFAVKPDAESNLRAILSYGALYVGVFVVWCGSRYLLNVAYGRVEAQSGHRLRSRIFSHVLSLRPEFFSEHRIGDVAADILKDTEITIAQFLKPVVYVTQSIVSFTIGLLFMLSIDWRMTLFVFPIGLFSAFLARRTTGRVKTLATSVRDLTTAMWGMFSEAIRGVREVQANRAKNTVQERLETASKDTVSATVQQTIFTQKTDAINSLFYMSAIGLIMTFGAVLVARGDLSVGGLAAFMMYNGMLTDPVMEFVDFYREVLRTRISIERLNGLLHQPHFALQPESHYPRIDPAIDLRGVRFEYPDGTLALKGIDLKIPGGSNIAIVGRSGCGKTTLSHLISGILTPRQGETTIGDLAVNDENLEHIRANLSIVFQDSFLFNRSFRENIVLGSADATEDDIRHAVKLACLESVVDSAEHGMNTTVGENGSRLSGGERQRVGLARAFLRDSAVYLLDEATSAVDSSTSRQVLANFMESFPESTIVVVAHKIASIENMPRIIVMKEGRIIADDSHKNLMDECSDYARLYEDQFSRSEG